MAPGLFALKIEEVKFFCRDYQGDDGGSGLFGFVAGFIVHVWSDEGSLSQHSFPIVFVVDAESQGGLGRDTLLGRGFGVHAHIQPRKFNLFVS